MSEYAEEGRDRKLDLVKKWQNEDPVYRQEAASQNKWWIDFTHSVAEKYRLEGTEVALQAVRGMRDSIITENGFTTREALDERLFSMFLDEEADYAYRINQSLTFERIALLDELEGILEKLAKKQGR